MPEIGIKIILVKLVFEMFEIATERQREWVDPEPKWAGGKCLSWLSFLFRRHFGVSGMLKIKVSMINTCFFCDFVYPFIGCVSTIHQPESAERCLRSGRSWSLSLSIGLMSASGTFIVLWTAFANNYAPTASSKASIKKSRSSNESPTDIGSDVFHYNNLPVFLQLNGRRADFIAMSQDTNPFNALILHCWVYHTKSLELYEAGGHHLATALNSSGIKMLWAIRKPIRMQLQFEISACHIIRRVGIHWD